MLVHVRMCLTLSDKCGADSYVPYTKYQMLVCVLCISYTLSSKLKSRSVFLCVPYTECQCWSVLLCV